MPQPKAIAHWGSVDSLPQNWNGAIAYLDRDGVINKGLPNYVKSLDELEIFDEALESIERLVYEGYIVCVVTNQSQVSRGYMSKSDLDVIHSKLLEISKIRLILTCIHHPNQECNCRKPSPGLLRLGDDLIRGSSNCLNMLFRVMLLMITSQESIGGQIESPNHNMPRCNGG